LPTPQNVCIGFWIWFLDLVFENGLRKWFEKMKYKNENQNRIQRFSENGPTILCWFFANIFSFGYEKIF